MKHTIEMEGFGLRLRPVSLEDAAFIVWIRGLEHARGRVGDSAIDVTRQREWLESYFKREGDYYFLIETEKRVPLGTYGVYDQVGNSGESGRWIVRPEVPAAIPSAILALDICFKKLRLSELRTTTVSTNTKVLSLNKKFGFKEVRVDKAAQVIGGQPVDLVRYVLPAQDWLAVRERLMLPAHLAEKEVRDWERKQLAQAKS